MNVIKSISSRGMFLIAVLAISVLLLSSCGKKDELAPGKEDIPIVTLGVDSNNFVENFKENWKKDEVFKLYNFEEIEFTENIEGDRLHYDISIDEKDFSRGVVISGKLDKKSGELLNLQIETLGDREGLITTLLQNGFLAALNVLDPNGENLELFNYLYSENLDDVEGPGVLNYKGYSIELSNTTGRIHKLSVSKTQEKT